MGETVIRVEDLSKQYRLGKIGTGSLSHDINRWWYKIRGKEDPYLKIGDANDRTNKGQSEYVWSLRDINFDIQKGDAVGIIGRNGAGKSTLLKILSRTTSPTIGSIKIKGRVASLLEVGTGFHPELTGRENIFLNGAILGMTKNEISKKFDEIVDFAGVERYVDTPVKRYSSGMYVRLAFGVAAHLEPDILVVDEVLAVGDAEFQKKALGKMKDVTVAEGRTVLFVSHNMTAIENLCSKSILLRNGSLVDFGDSHNVIEQYLLSNTNEINDYENYKQRTGNGQAKLIQINFKDPSGIEKNKFKIGDSLVISFTFRGMEGYNKCYFVFSIYNEKDVLVANVSTEVYNMPFHIEKDEVKKVDCIIDNCMLNQGSYRINYALYGETVLTPVIIDKIEAIQAFSIEGGNPYGTGKIPSYGIVILTPVWEIYNS